MCREFLRLRFRLHAVFQTLIRTTLIMTKKNKTQELAEATDKVIGLWLKLRSIFRKTVEQKEIEPEDEHNFLELKSHVARLQRFIGLRLPENYKFGSSNISDLMKQVVSLQALSDQPEQDKSELYNKWHQSYIMLQQLRGVIDVMLEGFPVTFEGVRRSSGNIKQDLQGDRGKSGKKAQKASKNLVTAVVSILVVGAVGYYLFKKYGG